MKEILDKKYVNDTSADLERFVADQETRLMAAEENIQGNQKTNIFKSEYGRKINYIFSIVVN